MSSDRPDDRRGRVTALASRKNFGACELAPAHLDAIAALNPRLNAYITVTPEAALGAGQGGGCARSRRRSGPLTGIPLAIKDLFCTAGVRTTAAQQHPRALRAAL